MLCEQGSIQERWELYDLNGEDNLNAVDHNEDSVGQHISSGLSVRTEHILTATEILIHI